MAKSLFSIGMCVLMMVFSGCATSADGLGGAVAIGNVRGAQAELQAGANPNAATFPQGRTPLQMAVRNANYQMARVLIEHGADVNAADWNGNTPLHDAVRGNYTSIARLLLENGADVQAKMYFVPPATKPRTDVNRIPPLTYATQRGYTNMASLLRNHGAKAPDGLW